VTRYRHGPAVLSRHTSESVLLRTLEGTTTMLRGTSIRVWDALATARSTGEVVELMRAEFDDPSASIAGDVASLLETLVRDGLVVVDDT
jgi:hypothetical protein